MKRYFAVGLAVLIMFVLLGVTGCGYRIGSIMHPQVKTIGIAAVVNDSRVFNAAADMRGLLSEEFMRDGSLKVVAEEKADCIVYARITQVTISEATTRSYNQRDEIFVPDEWAVGVEVEFSVVIPGRREPLIPITEVTGEAHYQSPGDMDSSSRRGIRQACSDAAKKLVIRTTEAW